MSQKQFKIKREIKFRDNILAEVPCLQEVRENEQSIDNAASNNENSTKVLRENNNVVLFKRRIKLNENVVGEVPVISPKRVLPTLSIPENINEINEPGPKSPEIEFDEIYDSLTNTPIDVESNIIEKEINNEKIDPALVEVKFEEILKSYENKQRPKSSDAQSSSKPSRIPIFRQLSETGPRILRKAPRRRSLDNKEFKDIVQSRIKTFETADDKIEDTQPDDESLASIVTFECVRVASNEDDSSDVLEIKEELILEVQPDQTKNADQRPVLAKFLNQSRKPAEDNKIVTQDILDVRRRGKSGIPMLKKSYVTHDTNKVTVDEISILTVKDTSPVTNLYKENKVLFEAENISTTSGENIVRDDINRGIKKENSKPVIVQEQIKENITKYVSNTTENSLEQREPVSSNNETKDLKLAEHQKYMEKKKYKEKMAFKPVSSKIAIFERGGNSTPKLRGTELNRQYYKKTSDYTARQVINNNDKELCKLEAKIVDSSLSTNKLIKKYIDHPKFNKEDLYSDILSTEDADTKIYETFNKKLNGSFNHTIQQDSILNANSNVIEVEVALHVTQKELENDKEKEEIQKTRKVEKKSDKELIKQPLAIFTATPSEEIPTLKRAKSLADIELGAKIQGKVALSIKELFVDKVFDKPVAIKMKERPRRNSVSEKIALFEKRITPVPMDDQLLTIDAKQKIKAKTQILNDEPETEKTARKLEPEIERKHQLIERLMNVKEILTPNKNNDIMPFYIMRDGFKMPVIALGTALLSQDLTKYVVAAAIELGYRAIDTAYIYGNERQVGEGIKMKIDDGTIKREDIFVISKLWNTYHAPALVEGACRDSLETLGLDYVDLYLIHQPMSFKEGTNPTPKIDNTMQYSDHHDFVDAWKAMVALKRDRLVRSIGVSNFNMQQLQTLIQETGETPVVNQVECHPYLTQRELSEFCTRHHIAISAYSTLGSKGTPSQYKSSDASAVIDDDVVRQLAKRLGITPTQVLLRYQMERGHCVVVKASSPEHLFMNLSCLNMSLNQDQVELLNQLNRDQRNFDFRGMGDTHKNYPFE